MSQNVESEISRKLTTFSSNLVEVEDRRHILQFRKVPFRSSGSVLCVKSPSPSRPLFIIYALTVWMYTVCVYVCVYICNLTI